MKKNIIPVNDKSQAHGYWEFYFNSVLVYKCFYHKNRKEYYEEAYHTNYVIRDSSLEVKIFHII